MLVGGYFFQIGVENRTVNEKQKRRGRIVVYPKSELISLHECKKTITFRFSLVSTGKD